MVYCQSTRKVLLPWRISGVGTHSLSFRMYYDMVVKPQFAESPRNLSEVFVGKGKDALFLVDSDPVIADVVPVFAPFWSLL